MSIYIPLSPRVFLVTQRTNVLTGERRQWATFEQVAEDDATASPCRCTHGVRLHTALDGFCCVFGCGCRAYWVKVK